MNSARDTILQLDVQLGDGVLAVNGSLRQVTNGGSFNHVTDSPALNGFVLGDSAAAVDAANEFNVSTAVLVASVISSLLSHGGAEEKFHPAF